MAKWEVDIIVRFEQRVVVDADSYVDAMNAAKATSFHMEHADHIWDIEPRRQLDEPWVRVHWYDLHARGDVVLATRAFGNAFTEADIELLKGRLRVLGLTVIDHWNGSGCDTASFRCRGRTDAMGEDSELPSVSQPRPEP